MNSYSPWPGTMIEFPNKWQNDIGIHDAIDVGWVQIETMMVVVLKMVVGNEMFGTKLHETY